MYALSVFWFCSSILTLFLPVLCPQASGITSKHNKWKELFSCLFINPIYSEEKQPALKDEPKAEVQKKQTSFSSVTNLVLIGRLNTFVS